MNNSILQLANSPKPFYMAYPYSEHRNDAEYMQEINRITLHLITHGVIVFSPLSYGLEIGLGNGYSAETCLFMDQKFLSAAEGLIVLPMRGIGESDGVRREVHWALGKGMPIYWYTNARVPEHYQSPDLPAKWKFKRLIDVISA